MNKQKKIETRRLSQLVSEHTNSHVLAGFDFEGNSVYSIHVKNEQDRRAMRDLLSEIMLSLDMIQGDFGEDTDAVENP